MQAPSPPPSPGSASPQRARSGGDVPFHMQNLKPKSSGLQIPTKYSKSAVHPNVVRSASAVAAARQDYEQAASKEICGPAAAAAARAADACRRSVNQELSAAGLPVPARRQQPPPQQDSTPEVVATTASAAVGAPSDSKGEGRAAHATVTSRKPSPPPSSRCKSPAPALKRISATKPVKNAMALKGPSAKSPTNGKGGGEAGPSNSEALQPGRPTEVDGGDWQGPFRVEDREKVAPEGIPIEHGQARNRTTSSAGSQLEMTVTPSSDATVPAPASITSTEPQTAPSAANLLAAVPAPALAPAPPRAPAPAPAPAATSATTPASAPASATASAPARAPTTVLAPTPAATTALAPTPPPETSTLSPAHSAASSSISSPNVATAPHSSIETPAAASLQPSISVTTLQTEAEVPPLAEELHTDDHLAMRPLIQTSSIATGLAPAPAAELASSSREQNGAIGNMPQDHMALPDGTSLPISLQPVILPPGSSKVVSAKVPMLLLPPPGASMDNDGLSGPAAARAAPKPTTPASSRSNPFSPKSLFPCAPAAAPPHSARRSARQEQNGTAAAPAAASARSSLMSPTTAEAVAKAVAAAAASGMGSGRRLQEPVEVQVALSVRRIWGVDFAAQTYTVALTAFTYHESHSQDSITTPRSAEKGLKLVNGDKAWLPKRFLPSLSVADAVEQTWGAWQFMLSSESGAHGRRMLLGKRELTATIRNDFDLSNFPFDTQTLELRVGLEADPSAGYMVPMRPPHRNGAPNVVDVAYDEILFQDVDFVDEVPHAQGIRIVRTLPPKNGPNRLYGSMSFSQAYVCIPIMRLSWYYMSTCGAVLFVLGLCSCATFAIPMSRPTVRLGADLILMLASTSFSTYLRHTLPRTAHSFTRLDRLSAANWMLLILISCCHGAIFSVQILHSEPLANRIDKYCWPGWTACWLLYVVFFAFSCVASARKENERMCNRLETFQAQHDTEVDIVEGMHAPGLPAGKIDDDEKARGKEAMPAPRKASNKLPKKLPTCVPSAAVTPAKSSVSLSKSPNAKPNAGPKCMV